MDDGRAQEAVVPTYEDLAGLMEHSLLGSGLSESDVAAGCELGKRYGIAAVIVRPSDLDLAARWMGGSKVVLGTVVDWPYGISSTSTKLFAVRDYLRRGAKEIDTVINTGKLVSRQFQYLEVELLQMADTCHQSGAVLKLILEDSFLDEELKMLACRISRRAGVDYIAASTVSAFATLKEHSRDRLRLKAAGAPAELDAALAFRDAGCARIESTYTAAILDAWKLRLTEQSQPSVIS
jgi:deoxyribose-phosphate aldolase